MTLHGPPLRSTPASGDHGPLRSLAPPNKHSHISRLTLCRACCCMCGLYGVQAFLESYTTPGIPRHRGSYFPHTDSTHSLLSPQISSICSHLHSSLWTVFLFGLSVQSSRLVWQFPQVLIPSSKYMCICVYIVGAPLFTFPLSPLPLACPRNTHHLVGHATPFYSRR